MTTALDKAMDALVDATGQLLGVADFAIWAAEQSDDDKIRAMAPVWRDQREVSVAALAVAGVELPSHDEIVAQFTGGAA